MENMNQQNETGFTPQPLSATQNQSESKLGPIVGIVIVVIVLIIGALYFWGAKLNNDNTTNGNTQPDQAVSQLQTQGAADTISAIETDLSATNLKGLDTGLQNELNSPTQ